jgi:hypothetical protein
MKCHSIMGLTDVRMEHSTLMSLNRLKKMRKSYFQMNLQKPHSEEHA